MLGDENEVGENEAGSIAKGDNGACAIVGSIALASLRIARYKGCELSSAAGSRLCLMLRTSSNLQLRSEVRTPSADCVSTGLAEQLSAVLNLHLVLVEIVIKGESLGEGGLFSLAGFCALF